MRLFILFVALAALEMIIKDAAAQPSTATALSFMQALIVQTVGPLITVVFGAFLAAMVVNYFSRKA